MSPGSVIAWLWLAFAISWVLAAFWAARPEKRAGIRAEAGYRAMLLIGGALFLIPARGYHGWMRLWSVGSRGAWICAGVILAGFAFCWWARIFLGQLWSSDVTKKQNHHIVETGPYALVRHPIYTGLLLAAIATAAAKGTLLGIAGFVLIALGFWMKARLEERFLSAELDAAAYEDYRRRVPMLVPFI